MTIDRLSGEYIRGYTKAIMDILDIFEYIQPDLRYHHKNLNGKLAVKLLKAVLDNRAMVRDGFSGFMRYRDGNFEWHETKEI